VILILTICGVSLTHSKRQQTPQPKPQLPRVVKFDGDMALLLATLADSFETTIGYWKH
jgi:hypothetical protein